MNDSTMPIYEALLSKKKVISVIGLGYVGLPLALEFARKFQVIGFDISPQRVALMQKGEDPSRELASSEFIDRDITFTADPEDLKKAHFHIVAVPTPIDIHKVPDLNPVISASHSVGKSLKKGDYVVYESTVYPGCTEEDCVPILEEESGMIMGQDFKVGYSPERINPGDKEHTVTNILKIVSGCDEGSLEEIAHTYGAIITAGIYKASSIKVAEAAKVIENTQRDLNIAFMNELAILFDRMGIDTQEVLAAAGTKWNFISMSPGLVGGHCIGVDPYYLTHKAQQIGYSPQVILSGRNINDGMPAFIAKRLAQLLIQKGKAPQHTRVLVMGMTFKENVSDIRNSKVADLVTELNLFAIRTDVFDPYADMEEVLHEYRIQMVAEPGEDYDAIIVAVNHDAFKKYDIQALKSLMNGDPVLVDIKALYDRKEMEKEMTYWRL